MTQPRRVVFWRHGRTDWNASGRFQGQANSDLDDVGIEQARAASVELAKLKPTVVMSSDLKRAHDTAQYLATSIDKEIIVDAGLRETDVGVWQGMLRADIEREHTQDLAQWIAGTNITLYTGALAGLYTFWYSEYPQTNFHFFNDNICIINLQ